MLIISSLLRLSRAEQENKRLKQQLLEQQETYENAFVELGELFAEQDDAIVELANILTEGE